MKSIKSLLFPLILIALLPCVGGDAEEIANRSFKKKLVYVGSNGFCNRLRSLASSVILAEATDRELLVYWLRPNEEFILGGADWSDLFTYPNFKRTDSLPIYGAYYNGKKEGDSSHLVRLHGELCIPVKSPEMKAHALSPGAEVELAIPEEYDEVMIRTIHNVKPKGMSNEDFYQKKRAFYKTLIPAPYIQKQIQKFSKKITSKTIGVHVRSTDLLAIVTKDKNKSTPYWKYEEEMNKALKKDPQTTFFLSTDSKQSLDHFLGIYGNKVVYFPSVDFKNNGVVTRTTLEATQNAIVDLFLLSKTSRIIGTQHSSFSYEAACLGGIPIKTVNFD